jgi:DNA repair protein RadC
MLALMGIRDWPIDERPREKLLERGAAALSDAEILAILLGSGRKGRSALDVARDAQVQAAAELSRRQLSESLRAGPLASPKATRDYLTARLRDLEHEVFCCLYLDKRHRLIQFEELLRGTIDGASVHPREIVKLALQKNAAAVIVAHNHPLCCVAVSPPQLGVTAFKSVAAVARH